MDIVLEFILEVVLYFLFVGPKDEKLDKKLRPLRYIINILVFGVLGYGVVYGIINHNITLIIVCSLVAIILSIVAYYLRKKYLNDKFI